jgi:transcriptional regulator with XRE-family HTH domain
MKQIGGTLRAFRLQRKLSLREVETQSHVFAEETGHDSYRVSASWLDRLERAEHKLTANKLAVLAHIYGVHPEELFRAMYPDSLGQDPPPDATALFSPGGPSQGPYRWGLIGRRDLTLAPLIRTGSVVQIDTRRRVIAAVKQWAHPLQRPIYFLMTRDAYFCGWCELDPQEQRLTLVPHPLSPASSQSWKYRKEVEIVGRVVAVNIRVAPNNLTPSLPA